MKNIIVCGFRFFRLSQTQSQQTGTKSCFLLVILFVVGFWSAETPIHAAGGGENMLLVVNPTDEPSLRIANAYVKARNIPVNNVVFIDPTNGNGPTLSINSSSFTTLYQTAIPNAIAARGLINQVDYIGTIGQPHMVTCTSPSAFNVGFHALLNHLTQFQNGMTIDQVMDRQSELVQNAPTSLLFSYTQGSNRAIHHSDQLPPAVVGTTVSASGTASYVQWYMSGMIGYAGVRGLTTSQTVESLQRTVKGDGANSLGTIYFENSDSVRSGARSPYWPPVQSYMDNIGIPWIFEASTTNPTPKNRANVRGAVVGDGLPYTALQMVNGSAYLPGAWADNLTSFGGSYAGSSQSVVSCFLLGGAGGTAGTVDEPLATQSRFTYASIFAFSNDGSTLGESFYKSVDQPDLLMFQGDLLSQAYADVPEVKFNGGPADGDTVSGVVSLSGSAHLNSPRIATSISRLGLFVDGLATGLVVNGSSGSFNLDTATLADGIHEMRIVAYNNSHAASEGYVLKNLAVNNKGQSVGITGARSYAAAWNQTLSIPVTSSQGSGLSITGIQLQCLGRVVGAIGGLGGNIPLDVTKLAYGNNTITPVAVLSSGSRQIQGVPITVIRQFQQFPGTAPTPEGKRNPGCDYYYFGGAAWSSSTLDNINWDATPSCATHSTAIGINPGSTYNIPSRNMPEVYRVNGYYAANLAIMIKSNFTVATAGEYLFTVSSASYSSAGLFIDGVILSKRDKWNTTTNTWDVSSPDRSIYLLPGEHILTIKLAQNRSGRVASECAYSLVMRGPDGNTIGPSAPTFYTVNKSL